MQSTPPPRRQLPCGPRGHRAFWAAAPATASTLSLQHHSILCARASSRGKPFDLYVPTCPSSHAHNMPLLTQSAEAKHNYSATPQEGNCTSLCAKPTRTVHRVRRPAQRDAEASDTNPNGRSVKSHNSWVRHRAPLHKITKTNASLCARHTRTRVLQPASRLTRGPTPNKSKEAHTQRHRRLRHESHLPVGKILHNMGAASGTATRDAKACQRAAWRHGQRRV